MFFFVLLFVFALVYVLTPWVIGIAWRIGALDVPTDLRRIHVETVPRCGGLAVFTGIAVGALFLGEALTGMGAVLWGSGLMLIVGLADDIFPLRAPIKLLFQISIAFATVLGSGFAEGGTEIALAVFWVVLLTNAHNFIDGMDGLLAGCAAAEAALLGTVWLLSGNRGFWQLSFLLSVALLSFRLYNRHPAQIFAGDCGSGCVGFLLGMLSLPLFSTPAVSFFNFSPLFLFAYPITDLVCSVIRRALHGRSPFSADRAHLHHRLYAKGLEQPECVALLLSVSISLGGVGVLLSAEVLWGYAAMGCMGAVFLLWYLRRRLEA